MLPGEEEVVAAEFDRGLVLDMADTAGVDVADSLAQHALLVDVADDDGREVVGVGAALDRRHTD